MKTDHILWNPSNLVHAGWFVVCVLALHWPAAAHADGFPDVVPTPPSAACEGPVRSRSAFPQSAPVAPVVPKSESIEQRSPEKAPSRAADGADDLILCACLSIEDIPLHDAIVSRLKLRAHA